MARPVENWPENTARPVENWRTRHAWSVGREAAVKLIRAGYAVKIDITDEGNIILVAKYRRVYRNEQHIKRGRIFKRAW